MYCLGSVSVGGVRDTSLDLFAATNRPASWKLKVVSRGLIGRILLNASR
jgi:hypothetical protein